MSFSGHKTLKGYIFHMKVLVVGSGGREHAIVWKLSQSPLIDEIICAPGNGGIASLARCFDVKATDLDGMCALAQSEKVDYVVVAPDDPLALGMVDRLSKLNIPSFGPTSSAAIIESSKVFSKNLMKKYGIPTAKYETFTDSSSAIEYIRRQGAPIVVKADGLALGKGVIVCQTVEEAQDAVHSMIDEGLFGKSGASVVIEEFMTGPEVTVLCFTDGKTISPMPSSQDHKRAFDGDDGPNTGGMGAISPVPCYTPEIAERCMNEIFIPTINAMNSEGRTFKGVIYFGLMLTPQGPKVVEYNSRFGDPECQALLIRLKSDLFEIMRATTDGTLGSLDIKWDERASCCVVMASGGYPVKYKSGHEICGIDRSTATIFHAGTRLSDGKLFTSGGRVLGVTALGNTLAEAIRNAYAGVMPISFENMYFRRDIGSKSIEEDE